MYYVEIRKQIQRKHDPQLVPLDTIWSVDGTEYPFRSVYAYTEETAEQVYNKRSTAGLQSVYKYSDMLFIDIDSDDNDVQIAGNKLCDLGLEFEYWTTGNRGGHFHLPLEPMAGLHTNEYQRKWVDENIPVKTDCTIYTCNGQFRMPHAVHDKTGKPKELQEKIAGKILRIDTVQPLLRRNNQWHCHTTVDNYVDNLTRYAGVGERHQRIMMIVKDGIKLGFSLDKVTQDVLLYNQKWLHPQMDVKEVIRHVNKTYNQYCDYTE